MTKRKRPTFPSSSRPNRRRPRGPSAADASPPLAPPPANQDAATLVVVTGLPADCSVLELKSRFEMYGTISRLRVDPELGFGYITFRSSSSAEAAASAEVMVSSKKVRVTWPNDPLSQWTAGVKVSSTFNHQPSSKLLQPETPLSKLGRGNKRLLCTSSNVASTVANDVDEPFKGRDIVAYDDLV